MMCCIFLAGQIVSAKSTPPVQTSSPADWSHKLLQLLGCVFCSWQWYFSNLDSPDVSAFSPEDSNICFSSLIPQMFWLMMIITKHSEYPNHLFGLFCYLLLYVSWRSWISVNDKSYEQYIFDQMAWHYNCSLAALSCLSVSSSIWSHLASATQILDFHVW